MAQIKIAEDAPRKWTKAEIYSWDWKPVLAGRQRVGCGDEAGRVTLQNVFNYSTRDVNERNISDDPVSGIWWGQSTKEMTLAIDDDGCRGEGGHGRVCRRR
ncbi:hypothetical protein C8J57DRAFT_1474113 [Mycena rebaudengoi]|nr:hypothetical protein C8J57DRAFT_1478631 [Mycena rebaudengoi]KAJ7252994.1 hypothetical protein C8J57DRAFT_1474113 [Mycena rebaudengoi]